MKKTGIATFLRYLLSNIMVLAVKNYSYRHLSRDFSPFLSRGVLSVAMRPNYQFRAVLKQWVRCLTAPLWLPGRQKPFMRTQSFFSENPSFYHFYR